MAAVDLDVLARLGVVIEAVSPAHDTVGAGVDRGGRHREVVAHIGRHPHLEVWGVEVSERPVGQARVGVGGCFDLERAAHRDHLPDRVRRNPGQFASEDATEAPPDDIDRAVFLVEFVDALDDAVEDLRCGAEVATEIPAVRGVAESIEGASQRQGGAVAGEESRHDEHGPVAAGKPPFHQRRRHREGAEFTDGSDLGGEAKDGRPRHPCPSLPRM